ncbi:acyltransferase [Rarobacter faecitabidus]|uniref:Peptidoglycan/LPS O-acetylase OafA/YrhL n=1 Tax=Rarobacter faecitabidus TaxID=13243 RepID=A0A542ZU49_RARFA|nr:acyltransferase [Rarobacter faecitabidus]TQL63888.1 peptidoglycan/LPS O-acetylase OafA/YrhL [Rarobacter faecitabidus]
MNLPVGEGHAVRLNAITGLRWWAALGVFAYHVTNVATLPGSIAAAVRPGYLGVTFFFVLSGFVLTWSMRAGTPKRTFYWRRFARIYPLHLLTLLAAIPVFYSFHPDTADWWVKPFSIPVLMLSVFVIQGWWRDPTILFSGNPAAWTLTAEAFFYATHPFLASGLRRTRLRGALIAAAGTIAFAAICRIVIIGNPGSWFAGLPWPILRLNEFVLGMTLAWAMRQGWRFRVHPLAIIAVAAFYFIGIVKIPAMASIAAWTPEVATVLSAALIVGVASREIAGKSKWLGARPLVALGEWSFAFYLIHATFIYLARSLFGVQPAGLHSAAMVAGLLAASIVVSWLLHSFFERPVESRLRAWQAARMARSIR